MAVTTRPDRPEGLLRWPSYPLGLLHRSANARLREAFEQAGLSLSTHAVLVCLAEDGAVSQQAVSDRLGVDRSDIVKRIDRLEGEGKVKRQPDPDDRRRHLLASTAKGRAALREGEEVTRRVTDEVFADLSKEERTTLHRLTLRALGEPEELAKARG